jgi:hypothetical protein
MDSSKFERILQAICQQLTKEAEIAPFQSSSVFENRVRELLQEHTPQFEIDYAPHPYIFPDITAGIFGVEVKFSAKDTWRSIANSVFESFRNPSVQHIYVVFGKMGGVPNVKWGRYEDVVMHVRTSHVPRFELAMDAELSLFSQFNVSYQAFSAMSIQQKMKYIREYARGRMKDGERLWWLEEPDIHSLPIQVKLYIELSQEEKKRLRAEAVLLSPKIVGGSRTKNKYNDVALYLLTYHGVLASQVRDLFSAGSVAMAKDPIRGGIYIMRALQELEDDMMEASKRMEDSLFVEYWGYSVPAHLRIPKWLALADQYAQGWIPSQVLFQKYNFS